MIRRPLWTLPLTASLIARLKEAGFEYVEDLLCEENKEELKQLIPNFKIDVENFVNCPVSQSALDLYKMETNKNYGIVTFSKAIDDLFERGIPTNKITEIVGAPGTGKTQICLQLCVSVQIPEFIGGISAFAVYISTNNNFSTKRIKEIHNLCVTHCVRISRDIDLSYEEKKKLQNFIQDDPMNCITRYYVETAEQLRASIFNVQRLLEKSRKNIRLLIIDSFPFPFYSAAINIDRTRRISTIMNQLNHLASSHNMAVVLTNDLTTFIIDNNFKEVAPSLGETFASAVHNRMVLGEKNHEGHYTAVLIKSSEHPSATAYFQITDGGIRDVPAK